MDGDRERERLLGRVILEGVGAEMHYGRLVGGGEESGETNQPAFFWGGGVSKHLLGEHQRFEGEKKIYFDVVAKSSGLLKATRTKSLEGQGYPEHNVYEKKSPCTTLHKHEQIGIVSNLPISFG